MSQCAIIFFENGKPGHEEEFSNAWGGAARIWTSLYDKYLKDPLVEWDSWLGASSKGPTKLWELAENEDLEMFERSVHASTFDYAIVRKENFARFAKDLRDFVHLYPPGKSVCHLLQWADAIESSDVEAVGFHGTSVSGNLWYRWDDEKDEEVPYDLEAGDKHFEIYEWLNSKMGDGHEV